MKNIILFILFILSCKTTKIDHQTQDNSLTELVSAILSEVTRRDRDKICLIDKSVSFDFRFPDSINEETDGLTEEEKRSIESEFSGGSIKWSEVLGKSFQTKGKNCIAISKPVLFRNGKRAFVYINIGLGAEFYDLYMLKEGHWKLDKTLITILSS